MRQDLARHARRLSLAAGAYTAVYIVLLFAVPAGLPDRPAILDTAYLPFHPFAAWALWLVMRAEPDFGPRWRGFAALSLAQVVGVVNAITWLFSSAGIVPLDSDIFQYVGALTSLLTVYGIARLVPPRASSRGAAVLPWLDITLFALAAFSVGWYFVGFPLWSRGTETATDFVWFAAITASDAFAALLAIAAWAYPSDRMGRSTAALLALALIMSTAGDIWIETGSATGSYVSGTPGDSLFALLHLVIVLAAWSELRRRPAAVPPQHLLTTRALAPLVATAAVFMPLVLGLAHQDTARALAMPIAIAATFVVVLQWRFLLLDREIETTLVARLSLERDLSLARQFESVGRFAGSVAHDFNNLLTVLLAKVQLLRMDKTLPPAVRESIDGMESTIGRGATLSRRLLGLMRGQDLPLGPIDVAPVVQALTDSVAFLLPPSVRLSVSVPSQPVWVVLRPGDAEQLLLNLLINARDAMPRGGALTVRLHADATDAVLEVEDEGTGIPDEIRDRIFEPLFTTRGSQRGTGLGLATVQSVLIAARGRVDLWSEVGKGTRFTVRLPLAR